MSAGISNTQTWGRLFRRVLLPIFLVLTLISVGGFYYNRWIRGYYNEQANLETKPLGPEFFIRVDTNGSSSPDEVYTWVDYNAQTTLMAVNAVDMQQMLEARGHVKRAEITKEFPDELRIQLYERQPILALATQEAGSDIIFWGVDAEGVVFKPIQENFVAEMRLPFLDGIALDAIEDGVTEIVGVTSVYELLSNAKLNLYHYFQDIRTISLEQFYFGEPELGSIIITRGDTYKKVIFATQGLSDQIERFRELLTISGDRELDLTQEIDFSINQDVIIRKASEE